MNCANAIYYSLLSLYSSKYAVSASRVALALGLVISLTKQPARLQKEKTMSKGQDSKKNVKKKPLLTAKEKKAAKQAKKDDNGSILGKH
ncbi:hypothetical protein A3K91_1508 [Psychrobacter alimentarius]|nr:hypothetical protein [Psychrobacter sp. PAMC27889]AMT97111.1 hypothetical protein A3K91_1508 [Psychrobacter alimentarius]QCB30557.1 hypothetical protein E5677_05845 [Psychrobacter sp. PAMC27889]